MRLNKNDIINLKSLLKRTTFNGLEEAEVAVVLSHKLTLMQEEANGSDLSTVDQPSPSND